MVRVTTGVHAGGHEYISTAHEDQKFGLSIASPDGDSPAMQGLLAVLARPELRLLGIHSHIGSQILDPSGFEVAARAVLTLRAQLAERTGVLVDEVDLGGGYGIAYLPGEVALDPDRIAKDVAASVAGDRHRPGHPAAAVLHRARPRDRRPRRPDALHGRHGQARADRRRQRPHLRVDRRRDERQHPPRPVRRAATTRRSSAGSSDAATVLARVVGKHCESGDIVVHEVQLPADVRAGDLLAVAATGAYGRSMASNYNHVPRPPVVAVADGASRVLVRRETEDDLLALDLG